MRFDINLASQPYEDVQRFLVRGALATVAAVIVCAILVYEATSAFRSWRVTEKQINALERQVEASDQQKMAVQAFLNLPEHRQTKDRSEFLNLLFARKAFSWTEVFNDLEHLVPAHLAVQSIEPVINDDDQLELRLIVSGASHQAAVELVRRLEESSHFEEAQIIAEARQTQGPANFGGAGGAGGWRFDISAIYIPGFARPAAGKTQDNAEANAGRDGNGETAIIPPAENAATSAARATQSNTAKAAKTEAIHARH